MAGEKRLLLALLAFFAFPAIAVLALYSSEKITTTPYNPSYPTITTPLPNETGLNQTAISYGNGSLVNLPFIHLPVIPLIYFQILAVVAVILLGLFFSRYISIGRFQSHKGITQGEFVDPLEERRKEIASVLEIASIDIGRDPTRFREIVLQCYRLILQILEDKAAMSGKNLTAREFKKIVSDALVFDSKALSEVTDLFELAKYSQKIITQAQAEEAAKCLRTLSKELGVNSSGSLNVDPSQS